METCKHGHPWTEDNTYWYTKNGKQYRQCRACKNRRNAESNSRRINKGGRIYVRGERCGRGHPYDLDFGGTQACSLCRKNTSLLHNYGITLDQYQAMLKAQGGRCAICRSKDPGSKKKWFAVDHDHRTGRVRGLLCCKCNRGLECFRDQPKNLNAAVAYLAEIRMVPGGRALLRDTEPK